MALKRPPLRKTSNGIKYLQHILWFWFHLMGKDIQRLEEGIFRRRRTEIIRESCGGNYKVYNVSCNQEIYLFIYFFTNIYLINQCFFGVPSVYLALLSSV